MEGALIVTFEAEWKKEIDLISEVLDKEFRYFNKERLRRASVNITKALFGPKKKKKPKLKMGPEGKLKMWDQNNEQL